MQILIKIVSFVLFILTWNILAVVIDNRFLFPGVIDVLYALRDIVTGGEFLTIIMGTMKKLFLAITLSGTAAIIAGVFSCRHKLVRVLLLPYVNFLKSVPTIAMIILVLIWARAEIVPVIVGSIILFPILYDNIIAGIESVDPDILKMSQVFKVSKLKVIRDVYIPGVYFYIAGGIHALIGLTFKVIIAGEVLSQEDSSIGGAILMNKIYLESSRIFAWVIVVILINFLIEQGVMLFNRKISSWR